MKTLHLLVAGNIGGIEVLMREYAKFSEHDNIFLFAWSGGNVADDMQKSGEKVVVLNKEKQGSWFVLKQILHLCRYENIQTVIVHHEAPLLRGALIAIKLLFPKVKLISYMHRNAEDMCGYGVRINFVKRIIYKVSFEVSDEIIAISEYVKKSITRYFKVAQEKITVIYNGVDIDKYAAPILKFSEPPVLMYVGRLVEEKGVQRIIEALKKMPANVNYSFKIVGDGSYRNELERFVNNANLSDKMSFLGERNDVSKLLAESDVFLHTPICEEGFGITVIEAMASGKLCVCAKSGAMEEVIQNKRNGYLIEYDGDCELVSILENILTGQNDGVYETLRRQAQRDVERFSVKHFVRALDTIIAG